MLPTNSNYTKKGCSPVSSNCVVWQGPDIECINLCKGDSITEVTYKLAEELCEILTLIDVSTYELDCLNLVSTPDNIKDLLEIITERICTLEGIEIPGGGGSGSSALPIVNIATCFYEVILGDTVTQLPLDQYVTLIGNRICNQIEVAIASIQSQLADHETRIDALESAPSGSSTNTILSGIGVPNPATGNDGDFYLDTSTQELYGPKIGGVWGSPVSLVGADAPPCTPCIDGNDGLDGNQFFFDTVNPTTLFADGDVTIVTDTNEIRIYQQVSGAWVLQTTIPTSLTSPTPTVGPNSYLFKANKVLAQNLKGSGGNFVYVNFEDDSTTPAYFDNNNVWTQFSWEPDQNITAVNFIIENIEIENVVAIGGSNLNVEIQFVRVAQSTGLVTSVIGSVGTITIPSASGPGTTASLAYYQSGYFSILLPDLVDIRLRATITTAGYVDGDIKINSGIIYNQN